VNAGIIAKFGQSDPMEGNNNNNKPVAESQGQNVDSYLDSNQLDSDPLIPMNVQTTKGSSLLSDKARLVVILG
jgi:hypothetical protein